MTMIIQDRAAELLNELDLEIETDQVQMIEGMPVAFTAAQALLEFAWGAYRVAQAAENNEAQEAADENALWATAGAIC